MKFTKCLTTVALVATLISMVSSHKPTPVRQHVTPKSVVRASAIPTPAPVALAATTAPAPVYTAGCAQYMPLIDQYNWNVNMAAAIMQAENTNCDPTKDNAGLNRDGSVDYGLFQVNSVHADMVGGDLDRLRNPSVNVAIAYSLSHDGTDWSAWSTYKNGRYLQFLK